MKIGSGLYEEQVVANKTINEVSIRGRDEPYFIDLSEDPKSFSLSFFFSEGYDQQLFDEVVRWLNVDYYEPLYFSEDIDRVFYCIPTDGIDHIHNGLKQGYLNLNMRCNSPKSFSHEQSTTWIDFYNGTNRKTRTELINRGQFPFYPEIQIEKLASGDIVINNTSNGNQELRLKNVDIGEQIRIDCKNEIIETNKPNTYRYDDFNDEYLEIVYGKNILKVSNNVRLRFKYRYVFS